MVRDGIAEGRRRRRGGRALRQGGQQGPAQGHVQDGHLDPAELPRRADLRGHRPQPRARSTATSPGPPSRIEGIGLDVIAARGAAAPPPRLRGVAVARRRPRRRAASTSGAGAASTTCTTRRPIAKLQHAVRAGNYELFKEYTRAGRRRQPRSCARCAACCSSSRASRSRSRRSSRRARSSSASRPAPCRSARSAARRTRPWPSP